jgi:hypothetical protein
MSWKGKLEAHGFTEELYKVSDESSSTDAVGDVLCKLLAKFAHVISRPFIELHRKMQLGMTYEMFEQLKYIHARLKEIVHTVKPDVIIVDHMFRLPSLMDQGK